MRVLVTTWLIGEIPYSRALPFYFHDKRPRIYRVNADASSFFERAAMPRPFVRSRIIPREKWSEECEITRKCHDESPTKKGIYPAMYFTKLFIDSFVRNKYIAPSNVIYERNAM